MPPPAMNAPAAVDRALQAQRDQAMQRKLEETAQWASKPGTALRIELGGKFVVVVVSRNWQLIKKNITPPTIWVSLRVTNLANSELAVGGGPVLTIACFNPKQSDAVKKAEAALGGAVAADAKESRLDGASVKRYHVSQKSGGVEVAEAQQEIAGLRLAVRVSWPEAAKSGESEMMQVLQATMKTVKEDMAGK